MNKMNDTPKPIKKSKKKSSFLKNVFFIFFGIFLSFSYYKFINKKTYSPSLKNDTFKLTYFGGNGRAAIIRAIFSVMKYPFENEVIEPKEWMKIKQSGRFEFQQMPILKHNEKTLSQSVAIYNYLSKLFGLNGDTLEEQYQIDSLISTIEDINMVYYPCVMPRTEEQKKNPKKFKEIFIEKFERYLKVFERRYEGLGKGKYFLGNKFTLADIFLTVQLSGYQEFTKENLIKKNAPKLNDLIERIKNNECKEFFEKYYVK